MDGWKYDKDEWMIHVLKTCTEGCPTNLASNVKLVNFFLFALKSVKWNRGELIRLNSLNIRR